MSRKEILGSKYYLTLIFASVLLSLFGIFSHNAFADQAISTIPVGSYPQDSAVNPVTNRIYITNNDGAATNGADSVSVIDGSTNSVVNTIQIGGSGLGGVGVNPTTNKIYAIGMNLQKVYVIDGNTNSITTNVPISNDNPRIVAINQNTNKLYVVGNFISVIDGSTDNITTTINSCGQIGNIVVDDVTNKIYVSCNSQAYGTFPGMHQVQVIDGSTDTVSATIGFPNNSLPVQLAVNPVTNTIYVESSNSTIYEIDGKTNIVTGKINDISQGDMAINPNTNMIYVANGRGNTISVIDGTNNQIIDTLTVGTYPAGLSVNQDTNRIYVVNGHDWTVSVIDGSPPKSLPQAPTNLSANTISSSQINLSWMAPSNDGGSQIIGYMIQRSTDSGTTWSTIVSNTASNGTTYSDTSLVHSTTYSYQVSAINDIGTSPPSNIASATTFDVAPSSPTGLTATGKITHVDLTWIAPGDNGGTPILGYTIQRSTDNGTTWSTIIQNTNNTGTTYTDSHLLPVRTYSYQVSAINSVGTSDSSNIVSTKPLSTPHLVSVSNKDETHFK